MQTVDDFPFRLGAAAPFLCRAFGAWFVKSFKNKLFVVVLESFRYLLPKCFEFLGNIFFGSGVKLYPAVIMVGVKNNVHSVVVSVVNHFLNAVKPFFADISV